MKRLVVSEAVETAIPHGDMEAMVRILERAVAGHERVLQLRKEGKVIGGGSMTGRKGEVLIVEADSNEELNAILRSIPYWIFHHMEITPLSNTEVQYETDRDLLKKLKAQTE